MTHVKDIASCFICGLHRYTHVGCVQATLAEYTACDLCGMCDNYACTYIKKYISMASSLVVSYFSSLELPLQPDSDMVLQETDLKHKNNN